jgi:hypothetical protein
VGWIFVLRIIAVALADTKCIIYSTPITPSGPMIHALQILATYMPQYHKSILPRAKMNIVLENRTEQQETSQKSVLKE